MRASLSGMKSSRELREIFGDDVHACRAVGAFLFLENGEEACIVSDIRDGLPRLISGSDVRIVDPTIPAQWVLGLSVPAYSIARVLSYPSLALGGEPAFTSIYEYKAEAVDEFRRFIAARHS